METYNNLTNFYIEKVLTGLYLDNDMIISTEYPLRLEDFVEKKYQAIYTALYNLYALGNSHIDVSDIDLTGYATESWVSANYQPKGDYQPAGNYLTSIPDEYITESELNKAISNIQIPSIDLTGYATENWVENKGYLTNIPEEYVTSSELETRLEGLDIGSGNVDLTGYATTEAVEAIADELAQTQDQLDRVMSLCERHGFFQISGEDINSPRQSFICKAMDDPMFAHLVDMAWKLVEREK